MKHLRAQGRDEVETAKDCDEYLFSAKRVMDTKSVYVVQMDYRGQCGPGVHSYRSWMSFDMTDGKKYDAARLYGVMVTRPGSNSVLRPELRDEFVGRMYPGDRDKATEACRENAAEMLPETDMVTVLTPRGLLLTRNGTSQERVCWDEVVFSYSQLKKYLNPAEALRLGWAEK